MKDDYLLSIYEKAIQLVESVNIKLEECNGNKEMVEDSIISTEIMYDMALGFVDMYLRCFDEELLKAGYSKQTNLNIH